MAEDKRTKKSLQWRSPNSEKLEWDEWSSLETSMDAGQVVIEKTECQKKKKKKDKTEGQGPKASRNMGKVAESGSSDEKKRWREW